MRHVSARATFLSGVAIAGAVVWGLVEFIALQWSRFDKRGRTSGKVHAV